MADIKVAFAVPRTPRMLGRVTFSDPFPRTPLVSKDSDIDNRLYKLGKKSFVGKKQLLHPVTQNAEDSL